MRYDDACIETWKCQQKWIAWYLPTWQKRPLYPGGHWQSKSLPSLIHVPPFLHGLGSHSESLEKNSQKWKLVRHKLEETCEKEVFCFVWTEILLTSPAVWRLERFLAFTLIERGSWSQHTFTTPTSTFLTVFWTWDHNTTIWIHFLCIIFCDWFTILCNME